MTRKKQGIILSALALTLGPANIYIYTQHPEYPWFATIGMILLALGAWCALHTWGLKN